MKIVFFTNAYMGIRCGNKSTGLSPSVKDKKFVEQCRFFFIEQLKTQRPRIILTLGKHVPKFLAPLADKLEKWSNVRCLSDIDKMNNQVVTDVHFKEVSDLSVNIVVLTHPCMRNVNVKNRTFKCCKGHEAELEMIKSVLLKN